jgi:N-methylhydantoinase A
VRTKLDNAGVRKAARAKKKAGIKAVAVCFQHSYANPAHEKRAGEIIAEEAPELLVTLSSEISPIYREYERTSTATLNAYVMPAVGAYVRRLQDGLTERKFKNKLFIMQSNGGVATPEIVVRYPIRIIESGPAAGVLTAAHYATSAGTDNLLSFDMGGTTAKLCLIETGRPSFTNQFEVDMVRLKKNSGLPINIPAIDLVEIGSGGGSIARVEMGAIAVGPESASSVPGPICYGRGGTQPTVTDADLVLGYLNPDYFLGGEMRLDLAGARRGIERHVGKPLGIDAVAAAWGIYEVVTAQMAQAARVVSVGRGRDPRHFAFIPFGGAGPVHGARLARMLGCPRVLFPHGAGVESAIGLLMAEPAFDLVRTKITPLVRDGIADINAIFEGLEAEGRAQLEACGMQTVKFLREAEMRFVGQGYEIAVTLPGGRYAETDLERLRDAFFSAYAATYGDRAFDRRDAVEIVHFRLAASSPVPPLRKGETAAGGSDAGAALKGRRQVYFPETSGFTECAVYDRYRLRTDDSFAGPAVVEERESTAVILPGSRARVDGEGNIIVDLDAVPTN